MLKSPHGGTVEEVQRRATFRNVFIERLRIGLNEELSKFSLRRSIRDTVILPLRYWGRNIWSLGCRVWLCNKMRQ